MRISRRIQKGRLTVWTFRASSMKWPPWAVFKPIAVWIHLPGLTIRWGIKTGDG